MQAFQHQPVLLAETLQAIRPRAGGRYTDGTVGGAGHAEAMLAASGPDGWLAGCDRDPLAIEAARRRLAERFAGRFELRLGNFEGLAAWVPAASCDGVLLDLGVSSPQLDQAERGFSFQQDGPLDMRMSSGQGTTAADWVNEAGADELAKWFWQWGDEPNARRIARALVERRRHGRIETTRQLADLIERVSPRRGQKTHPATRVFLVLRMLTNDELGCLARGLAGAVTLLKPGGRLVVITFHSVEDRAVKDFGNERARDYAIPGTVDVPELRVPKAPELRWVSRKAIRPGAVELAENPRSRSAQLRVLEKL